MKNGKKKILLAVGFGDHTLAQVNGAQKNFEALAGSSHLNRFKAVVMVGRSGTLIVMVICLTLLLLIKQCS